MERRNSHNDEPAQPTPNPDVFDDDYEIDADEDDFMPSVSDGFRPADAAGEEWHRDRHDHDRRDAPQRHTSTSKTPDMDLRRMATRNSTAKTQEPMPQDIRPFAMHNRGTSSSSPLAHRASVSSTGSFATTTYGDNPFETGPSHPYGMYPQHTTVARSSSVATPPVDNQSSRPMSMQRPTHPYAMYSQSGLDQEPLEESDHPSAPPTQTAIPVGFNGLNNGGYHRVLGPDGEEQDIIGPDGHTEQLPPYSRYPEAGPTKASLAAEASASRIIPAPNTLLDTEDPFMAPVSPASPLSSSSFSAPALPSVPLLIAVTPARLPPQRPETQTGSVAQSTSATASVAQIPAEPSDSSSASLLTNESSFNEKDEPDQLEPKWYRRRLWGKIPIGWAVVLIVVALIAAIILGAAVGTLVAKQHGDDKNKGGHNRPPKETPFPQVSGPHGSLFDATPIPTPPGLAPLPTGAFSLPLGLPQESNPGCLTQANQFSAWSCKITFAPLVLTVNNTMTSAGARQVASLKNGNLIPDGTILYGLQTPDISFQPLQLVLDLDYKAYGPAHHFYTRYDKLVILRPEELNSATGLVKRQDDKNSRQRFSVRPGENPWYCWWNQTYIEGYVYVENNSTAGTITTLPTPTGSATASFDTASFMAAMATGSPSTGPGTSPTVPSAANATPSKAIRRDAQSDPNALLRIAPYPRLVKIEERRLPDSPQPYCQQMVMLDNGRIQPAPNGNDRPKQVLLQAVDPSYEEYFAAQASATGKSKRDDPLQSRSDPSDACHCQWMFK